MKKLIFIFFLLLSQAFASDMTPTPTSNSDLRDEKEIFVWDYAGKTLKLILKGENDYHLVKVVKKKTNTYRVSSQLAEKIDEIFVAKFIDLKYSKKLSLEKDCGQISKMTMRGEIFEFCLAKNKAPLLESFWEELNNHFKD